MKFISQIKNIKSKISGEILFDENLSKHSWFNIGGLAKVIFKPGNLNELSMFLKTIKDINKIKVLGVGSNTLIRDGGFNGIIIKLGKSFGRLSLFDTWTIIAGSSALDKNNEAKVLNILKKLNSTIIFSTHKTDLEKYFDKSLKILNNKIIVS